MPAYNSYFFGKVGEEIAQNYLNNLQWQIIKLNYKCSYGEIDVLATKADSLVAFEVKRSHFKDNLFYYIKARQRQRIINALMNFISNNPKYSNFNLRLDALLIYSPNNIITHITNAWSLD